MSYSRGSSQSPDDDLTFLLAKLFDLRAGKLMDSALKAEDAQAKVNAELCLWFWQCPPDPSTLKGVLDATRLADMDAEQRGGLADYAARVLGPGPEPTMHTAPTPPEEHEQTEAWRRGTGDEGALTRLERVADEIDERLAATLTKEARAKLAKVAKKIAAVAKACVRNYGVAARRTMTYA